PGARRIADGAGRIERDWSRGGGSMARGTGRVRQTAALLVAGGLVLAGTGGRPAAGAAALTVTVDDIRRGGVIPPVYAYCVPAQRARPPGDQRLLQGRESLRRVRRPVPALERREGAPLSFHCLRAQCGPPWIVRQLHRARRLAGDAGARPGLGGTGRSLYAQPRRRQDHWEQAH